MGTRLQISTTFLALYFKDLFRSKRIERGDGTNPQWELPQHHGPRALPCSTRATRHRKGCCAQQQEKPLLALGPDPQSPPSPGEPQTPKGTGQSGRPRRRTGPREGPTTQMQNQTTGNSLLSSSRSRSPASSQGEQRAVGRAGGARALRHRPRGRPAAEAGAGRGDRHTATQSSCSAQGRRGI